MLVFFILISHCLSQVQAWSSPSTFPTSNDHCSRTIDAAERQLTLLQAGHTLNVTLKSDSCKLDYALLYLYNERNWRHLCSFSYKVIDDFTMIASCSIPTGPNTNGNYTLSTYWYDNNWMYLGSDSFEDKFMVVDGIEPDLYVPQVQNDMLTPTSTSINVSFGSNSIWEPSSSPVWSPSSTPSSSIPRVSSFIKIIEEGSGVSWVWGYATDSRGQLLCSNSFFLNAGNEFDGVWKFDCDIYTNMYTKYTNGNATISYYGYDRGNNYFSHSINNALQIVGGMDPEFILPVIESFALSSHVVSINETLTMDLAVSDVGSGINYAYCNAYMKNSWYGYGFNPISDSYDMKYRQYTFSKNMSNLGDYTLQCYAYDNHWNMASSDILYFSVVNAPTQAPSLAPTTAPTHRPTRPPTPFPSLAPSLSPTLAPTFAPTAQPSAANIPTSNTTTVTITITIEVSGKPAKAFGRRLQAVSNSTDTPSCKQSISYVLSEALKHYESEAISAVNLVDSTKLPSAANSTLHQLLWFKMNVTAEDITPEQLYAKFKNGTGKLNIMQLDQISQFIGAYSADHNCAAFSSVNLGKPEVMSSYTSYVESGSTSEPIFCPTNSDDAKLSIDAVIGIAFAVAFSSFCLFSLFLYWYVKVYQKNLTSKKVIEHHTADLNVISTQVNPI